MVRPMMDRIVLRNGTVYVAVKRSTWLLAALLASISINVGVGVALYRTEHENRQALAFPAERISYRLLQLAQSADGLPDDRNDRARVSHAIQEVVEHGQTARRIPAHGLPH